MSQLLDDDGQPLAIRWLKDLKGVVGTCDPTLHSMPECLDELEDWAYVRAHEPKSGGGRQLFYKDIANGMTPVTIVVYGCVKEASLAPLGDWTGKEHDASWASRNIDLEAGQFEEAFQAQMVALQRLSQYVSYAVRSKESTMSVKHLLCKQRVFTMVRDRKNPPSCTLRVGDDPEGLAELIRDKWVAASTLELRKRLGNGNFKSATPLSFAVGDLVEVEAAVDIILRRSKTSASSIVETRLRPLRITKMASCHNLAVSEITMTM